MIPIPDSIKNGAHPITILVIGAGGTGSQVLTHLGSIHTSLIALGKPGLQVWLQDHDSVSEANIGRQLFSDADVGRMKAHVLIERINRFFGTSWTAVTTRFHAKHFGSDITMASIIISCTDNVKSRRDIQMVLEYPIDNTYHEAFENWFWIDTGNTRTTGQVILGSPRLGLPTVIEQYPDIEEHEDRDLTPSCSLAEALKKQHLFINRQVAVTACHLVWDICTEENLTWRGARINLNAAATVVRKIPIRENQINKNRQRGDCHTQPLESIQAT